MPIKLLKSSFVLLFLTVVSCKDIHNEVSNAAGSYSFTMENDSVVFNAKMNPNLAFRFKRGQKLRIVLLSTSLIHFFEQLGASNLVVGLHEANRVKGDYTSVGQGTSVDVEKIMSLEPDVIIGTSQQNSTASLSVFEGKLLNIDNYLEPTPLGKLNALMSIGILVNKYDKALALIDAKTKLYNQLDLKATGKRVYYLSSFGNKFYKSGCDSYVSQLIQKAGAKPVCITEQVASKEISSEEAFLDLKNADLVLFLDWKNEEIVSRKEMWFADSDFGKMIQDKPLVYCNTLTSGFYQSGELEPSILAKEINQVLLDSSFVGRYFKRVGTE